MPRRLELERYVRRRSDARSLLVVVAHVGFVLAPVYIAAALPLGWHVPLLWIWFGFGMNGLLNLMHEASHFHVFKRRWGSNALGRLLLGPLALTDFDAYRWRHWEHHRFLGVDGDTKDAYLVDIRGWRFPALILRCLLLIEALGKFRHQMLDWEDEADRRPPPTSRVWMLRTVLLQIVMAASLVVVATATSSDDVVARAAVAHLGVYLYGVASLTVFAATLRAIAEHQIEAGGPAATERAALRNFAVGPVEWMLFGAYGFAEHATHHLEPAIPYYRLGDATSDVAADEPLYRPTRGYLAEIIELIREPESAGGPLERAATTVAR